VPWRTIGRSIVASVTAVALVVACFAFASFALPWWFNAWETVASRILPDEAAVRAYLAVGFGLALAVAGLRGWHGWSLGARRTWISLAAGFALLLVIFALDESELRREPSWIRYPTGGALGAAGITGLTLAVMAFRRRAGLLRAETLFWVAIGCAFLFLGGDELFEFHEQIGKALESSDSDAVPRLSQNAVTALYALLALLAFPVLWKLFGRHLVATYPWLLRGYATGIAIFVASQAFDLLNKPALRGLRRWGHERVGAGELLPDLWYVLYRPRHVLNSVEEVLECTAAILLLVLTARVLVATLSGQSDNEAPEDAQRGAFASNGSRALGVALVALSLLGASAALRRDPLLDEPPSASPDGATLRLLRADESPADFESRIALQRGAWLTIDPTRRAIEVSAEGADGMVSIRARRMLGELRGGRVADDGRVELLTGSERERTFLPDTVWTTRLLVAHPGGR